MPQLWFFMSIAFSFVAWGMVTARYIWPELRLQKRADALRPLLMLHSFRFIGLAFLVPGVVSPDLPSTFAHSAGYGDIIAAILAVLALISLPGGAGVVVAWIFQSLGFSRYRQRFLPGQSGRALAGAVGSHLFPPDLGSAVAANHARTRFPDSPATSKCTSSTGKPATGMRSLGHRKQRYSCRTGRSIATGDEREKLSAR